MQINAQNRNEIQKEQIMVEILFGESSSGSMKAANARMWNIRMASHCGYRVLLTR